MAGVLESSNKPVERRDVSDVVRIMTGQVLTYENLIETGTGIEIRTMQLVANQQYAKVMGCIMLPVAFMHFALFVALVFQHLDVTNVYLIESELRDATDGLFDGVEDLDSLWEAINPGFVETFFQQTDSLGEPLSKGDADDKWGMWGRVATYNQLQAAIRFQQSRRTTKTYGEPYTCSSNITCFLCRAGIGFQTVASPDAGFNCTSRRLGDERDHTSHTAFSYENRRLSLMPPPLGIALPKVLPESSENMFRFYIYPSETDEEIKERLSYFQERRWLDGDTETVSIRLYLLNTEFGQPNMEQLTINFFISEGGSIYYTRNLEAIFFKYFPSMLTMAIDGMWFLSLLFSSIVMVITMVKAFRGATIGAHLKDGRNILEFFVLAGGWVVCYQFYWIMIRKDAITKAIEDVRQYGWNLNDSHEGKVDKLFETAGELAGLSSFLANMFSIYTLLTMYRFFVMFGAQPRLAIITRTLSHLVTDLAHFLVVFVPSFLVYVTSGMLMFGRRMECYATFGAAVGCTFRMAQEGEFDWGGFKQEFYWTSLVWIFTFILFINILFINLVLAIILDVYNEMRGEEKTNEAFWETLDQFWHRFLHMKSWVREGMIQEKCSLPDREDVVTQQNFEAYFPMMPRYQMDLLFRSSTQAMSIQSEKDLGTENLLKLSRSMMENVGSVNESLRTIVQEEAKDSLQSWVVPKKAKVEIENQELENFITVPVITKGNQKARLTPADQAKPFEVDGMPWAPEWLREVGTMLKTQRQWLSHAMWQLEQLQWNMQNAHVAKLQEDKFLSGDAGVGTVM
eukprot:TRINITY_DN20375_c0_g1_i1.p1 TRINITY_DN20375_c0_g1~~TRINITY_DN20375_c0_g1_i1.p1  ORF type:complete len:796 (+),score=128.62 TRINITY_DN20375_c0_g1_i1:164-2551(+)